MRTELIHANPLEQFLAYSKHLININFKTKYKQNILLRRRKMALVKSGPATEPLLILL